MFDKKSRYANSETLIMQDARGREVQVTAFAEPTLETFRGIHVLRQGERIDHLATHYLSDSTGYWRIAELNDAMTAEVLTEQRKIDIPTKT